MPRQTIIGYHKKILEIDLSTGNIRKGGLEGRVIEEYIGGRGLATRLFADRIDPLCDPLGPENVLVIAASALVGTRAPTGCRGHMVFKSPLTGIIGSSNCGGTWAHSFKSAGYDALIIKGKSANPVVIDIGPEGVEIHRAEHVWGMNVHETTEVLTAEALSASFSKPRILCIGPAGENLVRFAAVMNDKNRAYGRGGPGAVFGSKNLKAVRVTGPGKTPEQPAPEQRHSLEEKGHFTSGLEQARYLLKAVPATKRLLREMGTAGLVELINIIDMLPHKNFQDTRHKEEDVEKVSGERITRDLLEKAGACYGCPILCQRHTRVGKKSGEGPEYETDVMMGPNCGIYELEAITRANYRCNELGMDTISFGGSLACAMELFERGHISREETGGLELTFGNAAGLETMVELTAARSGFGSSLAEGSFRLANTIGHPGYSMTVKKLEIPAYDPRASYTQALGYVTSPTGACHLRGGYAVSLAFFGGTKEIPRFSLHQSPLAIRNMQNLGILQDSLGVCRFTGFAFSLDPWSRMVSGLTGLPLSTSRMEEAANRIAALERMFNIRAGISGEDDRLPARFTEEPICVSGKDRLVSREDLEKMKQDYYAVRGWDAQGVPTQETCKSLNILS